MDDDAVDAVDAVVAGAADAQVESNAGGSDAASKECLINAEASEASIASEAELIESLSDDTLIPFLQEKVEPFIFPKECSVRIRKLTEQDVKLLNRFLKVDSVTPISKKISNVTYTVKDTRFESEIFEKKHETIRQELARVRTLLENRRQWFELYAECAALIEERGNLHKEIADLDEFIDANTPDEDDLDLDPDPDVEEKLEDFIKRKEELLHADVGLRQKELGMQSTMKQLDLARKPLEQLGVLFDEDESWMDDAARESLESLLAKMEAERKAEEDAENQGEDDEDDDRFEDDEWMDRSEGSLANAENLDENVEEELAPVGSTTIKEEMEEEAGKNKDPEDTDTA